MPVARATAIRAFEPFDGPEEAAAWLAGATAAEESIDAVLATGIALLNNALHAQAVAVADPLPAGVAAERAIAVRLGYGSGEETAEGAYSEAREVDVWARRGLACGGGARRRCARRNGSRRCCAGASAADACETLLLRARADLDAGRRREAALQLRVGVEALLFELPDALEDPDHARDIEALEKRRPAVEAAAERALRGDLAPEAERSVREALELAERDPAPPAPAYGMRVSPVTQLVAQVGGDVVGFGQLDPVDRGHPDHGQPRGARRGDAGRRVLQRDHAGPCLDPEAACTPPGRDRAPASAPPRRGR